MAETLQQSSKVTGSKDPKQEPVDDQVIDIIDTHIHLYNKDTCEREWMLSEDMAELARTYDINEYYSMYINNQNAPFINLKCGIFMETDVVDASVKTEIAEITNLCKNPNHNLNAMIVQLDPNKPTKEFVESVNELKQNPFIVGVRKCLFHEKLSKEFIKNLQILSDDKEINWVFDIVTNIQFLAKMESVVKALPNQTFVVDHMANHHQICGDKQLLKMCKEQIINYSKHPNVRIKLSGLTGGTPSAKLKGPKKKWCFEDEVEMIDFVIKHFNEDRIVYGSDWPVSCLPIAKEERGNFLQLWPLNLYKYLKKKYGKAFCDKIFVQNPIKIYNLSK